MTNTSIKDLPIDYEIEYKIIIQEVLNRNILISLDGKNYSISKPKNKTWKNIKLQKGMECIVKKVKYGQNNEYTRLDLISVSKRNLRKFKLPGIDDLNKDQDRVLRLPEDGQFLIIGGPGTGKSIVALLRAMKYHKNDNYVFLTFNKVLLSATKQLVDFDLNSATLDSWIGKEYWKLFQEYIPHIEGSKRKPDYDKMIKNLESRGIEENPYHLIIDEGQDKPPKYYETLMYFGIENF
ncbi:MAG: hypothetical protein DSY76_05395, partial [Bacteroidetes bacterium]